MGTKLYVGNLSYDTTEESLNDAFSKYGEVTISLIKNPYTGQSKGFGFAEFQSEDAAKAALEMNDQDLDGRTIVVNEARPQTDRPERGGSEDAGPVQPGNKLYVGNLSYDLDEGGLQDLFSKYGEIDQATIIRFPDTGKSKGFGFVQFKTIEEAEKAVEMNGQEIEGRKIVVNMARAKTDRPRRNYDRNDRGGSRYSDDGGY